MTSPSLPPPDTCPAGAQNPERPTPSPAVPRAGIVPPLATPLLAPDRLDIDGLERLINHLVAGGVHGLFILGTTGEGPSLSQPLRRELVSSAIGLAAGRLPVLVGISDAAVADSLALAHHAADAGAAAVVAAPPFYFPASQDQLECNASKRRIFGFPTLPEGRREVDHFIGPPHAVRAACCHGAPSRTQSRFRVVGETAENVSVM